MAEYIDREPNQVLDNLKSERIGKQQGYATAFVLAGEPLSDYGTPRTEIVLLDPVDDKVSFRMASRALGGDGKDIWQEGDLIKAVEEGLTWLMEMEEVEGYRWPAAAERPSGS